MSKKVFDKVRHNKKRLVDAMIKSLGIISSACAAVKLDRQTFYNYYNSDPAFKTQIDSIQELALDFAETSLLKNIKEGDTTSIIFYLKCKGKIRGYVEKQSLEITNGGESVFKIGFDKPEDEGE